MATTEELVETVPVRTDVEAAGVEIAEVVEVLLVPATKGVPSTWVKSIQLVLAKKLSSSN